jgi:radical SAM superfamily enzyme YgiQ (UPF0313 family)
MNKNNARRLKILLVLPAGQSVRVVAGRPQVPRRKMLRFSVLPLTVVAALTPPQHEVTIVDENVQPLDLETDCDLVGISFMTALAPRAYEIADHFRAHGKLVVAGGYHATLCPRETARHFDAVVQGDAAGVWEELIEDALNGRVRPFYRQDPSRSYHTPVPRRGLLASTAGYYATINAVQAGRGCRHNCRYCSVTAFHRARYQPRPVPEVIAELRELPRGFIFVDDNIIAERDYALELFQAMVPLRKFWVSQCAVLIADDPELLRWAQAAGCRGLFIGIETANDANLVAMNKQFNQSRSYAERIRRIRAMGIGVIAGMIVGMDGDDVTVFERTLRFLQQNRVDAVQLNILTPLPGTPLYGEIERSKRITDRDWSHYDYRHVVFDPAQMSAADLQAGADWVYSQFYRLDRVLWRFVRGVFTIGWLPAWLGLKLGLTYRYDNRREGIVGRNPARRARPAAVAPRANCEPRRTVRVVPGYLKLLLNGRAARRKATMLGGGAG